jgi:hypothetical protein
LRSIRVGGTDINERRISFFHVSNRIIARYETQKEASFGGKFV